MSDASDWKQLQHDTNVVFKSLWSELNRLTQRLDRLEQRLECVELERNRKFSYEKFDKHPGM